MLKFARASARRIARCAMPPPPSPAPLGGRARLGHGADPCCFAIVRARAWGKTGTAGQAGPDRPTGAQGPVKRPGQSPWRWGPRSRRSFELDPIQQAAEAEVRQCDGWRPQGLHGSVGGKAAGARGHRPEGERGPSAPTTRRHAAPPQYFRRKGKTWGKESPIGPILFVIVASRRE